MGDIEQLFQLSGTIKINGQETSVSMFLDNDSVGHQLKESLIAQFNWTEIDESQPFKHLNYEMW